MALQVVLLPGICGSELYLTLAGRRKLVWPDPVYLTTVGPGSLQLAANGLDPGPLALAALDVGGYIQLGIYEPVHRRLNADGWTVRPIGYDWRKSVAVTAPLVKAAILAAFPADDVYIVAHSMGGLVARAVYGLMTPEERQRVKRLVTLGTPHGGAPQAVWEMASVDWIPGNVALVASVVGLGRDLIPILPGQGKIRDQVRATIASWPGLYELFPSPDPRWPPFPDLTLPEVYQALTYFSDNPFVTQTRLDAAKAQIAALDALIPATTPPALCVVGRGAETRERYRDVHGISSIQAWDYTTTGDGIVTTARGILPGSIEVNLDGLLHMDYMQDSRVLTRLTSFLLGPADQQPAELKPIIRLEPPAVVGKLEGQRFPDFKFPDIIRKGDP